MTNVLMDINTSIMILIVAGAILFYCLIFGWLLSRKGGDPFDV